MAGITDIRRLRAHAETGTVLVEFALVGILLFTILAGVFEFGLAFNDQSSLREATRDAARAATADNLTDPSGTPYPCTTIPALPAGPTSNLVCLLHHQDGLSDSSVRVMVLLPSGTDTLGDEIVVCSEHQLTSITGLYQPILGNKIESARVAMRAEQAAGLTQGGETPFAQKDWSFCTG